MGDRERGGGGGGGAGPCHNALTLCALEEDTPSSQRRRGMLTPTHAHIHATDT